MRDTGRKHKRKCGCIMTSDSSGLSIYQCCPKHESKRREALAK